MKSIFTFIAISLLVLFSCRKENWNMSDAVITGVDGRECACCGGYWITFNDNAQPLQDEFKLITNGEEFGISNKDSFPLYVKVDWETLEECGQNERIKITRLERK